MIALMTAAIGVGGTTGLWVVAVLGGLVLGVVIALAAVGVAGVNRSLRVYDKESLVDPVTQLPNADKLVIDLGNSVDDAMQTDRTVLSLYLLDGIKKYNDAYGRACGDALLLWLAHKLRDAIGDRATAYRMRGGDFAVLADGDEETTAKLRADAAAALLELGEGFVVSCSVGEAVIPEEAVTVSEALKLADHRAHARRKAARHDFDQRPPQDPTEAMPASVPRFDVAALANAVAAALDYPQDLIDDLSAAAHLRDIGNMAIPSVALEHSSELAPEEWQFVRLHTVVGERLLAANFGMEDVAALVRSSHERWDGHGYPDGLRGEEIPLGSRILFVCSAFEDMTSARAHRPGLDVDEALAELDRGAGTQFDPAVVTAFRESFAAARGEPRKPKLSLAPTRLRVLVADDDPASRFLLWRAVETAGHDCTSAQDGTEALARYREQLPDVVICDSRLPELDGNELCRSIRDTPEGPFTYFVMIAAVGDLGRIRGAIGAGADDFLTKPIVRQELEMRLAAAARAIALRASDRRQAAR